MLIYHQAFDTYHCLLRIITFLNYAKTDEHDIDSVRIFDYYFCVPTAFKNFIFPQELRRYRKIFSEKINHYNDVPNQRALFYDLKLIQDAAFEQMISLHLIDCDSFRQGKVLLIKSNISQEMLSLIETACSIDNDVKEFVLNNLAVLPLLGINGLKHRSGLMDYRYDLV